MVLVAGGELERRYSETRRRHPLALDRPASDGIARERELLAPLRNWANRLIDTTDLSANELAQQIRANFAGERSGEPTLLVTSFGFARGLYEAFVLRGIVSFWRCFGHGLGRHVQRD